MCIANGIDSFDISDEAQSRKPRRRWAAPRMLSLVGVIPARIDTKGREAQVRSRVADGEHTRNLFARPLTDAPGLVENRGNHIVVCEIAQALFRTTGKVTSQSEAAQFAETCDAITTTPAPVLWNETWRREPQSHV